MSLDIFATLVTRKFWNIRWRVALDVWEPEAGKILLEELLKEAPYDDESEPFRDESKPHLRDQLGFKISGSGLGTEGRVEFYGPELANLLEAGSDPHEIDGNDFLHFYSRASGDELFAETVMHPGFQRNRFIQRAYRNSRDRIFRHFEEAVLGTMRVE